MYQKKTLITESHGKDNFRKQRPPRVPHLPGLHGFRQCCDRSAQMDGAVRAVDLKLTADEITYLEEPYVPHALVGIMAQNGKQKAGNVV
ncbi:hypothetical protein [uncultured Bacteroides sp.]|uniref:hypothetical protein n=1 Tax=uncultured Bacteroides sp. TaxID=162156 RepID=UPI0025F4A738|nr:hypothetical protein [uncultured Bacteroides sp.]